MNNYDDKKKKRKDLKFIFNYSFKAQSNSSYLMGIPISLFFFSF